MFSANAEVPETETSAVRCTQPSGREAVLLAYRPNARPPVVSFRITVRQLARADGFTQASSVIAVVRCNDAASGTFTLADVPLNVSAPPNLPAVDQVAAEIVPVLLLPDASAVETPVPALKEYAATSPFGA